MLQNKEIPLEEWFSLELIMPWNKFLLSFPFKNLSIRGVFRTQQNISDGFFCENS